MTMTKEQAIKTRDTNISKDPEYYSTIGYLGGSKITENTKRRGFGSLSPERRIQISRLAGKKSAEKRKTNGN